MLSANFYLGTAAAAAVVFPHGAAVQELTRAVAVHWAAAAMASLAALAAVAVTEMTA